MMERNEIEDSSKLLSRDNNSKSELLRISIQLPKILIPCVDDICTITRRDRDCLFTYFVICGLTEFFDDPEKIFNFAKRTPDFSERLRIGLNNSYRENYFETKKHHKPENTMRYNSPMENKIEQPQSTNELNSDIQNFEFKLMIPDILIESFTIFCEITNRTKEALSKMFVIDQLAFIYQNPELIYDYIKDYESLKENLRIGLNLIFGRNYFKKKVEG